MNLLRRGFEPCWRAIRIVTKRRDFYWQILPELWAYAANRIGEVADTVVDIDRAMKAGFNWELGPFEMWDAAGFVDTVEKMRARGQAIPPVVERMVSAGVTSWYRNEGGEFFDVASGEYRPVVEPPGMWSVARVETGARSGREKSRCIA